MMGIKRKASVEAYIPTASMADIAFLLITFFMVSTTFQVDKTSVRLPVSVIQNEVPKGAAFVVLQKVQGGDPEAVLLKFSDGKENSFIVPNFSDLSGFIQNLTAKNSMHIFVIKADKDVAYRKIDEALDALKRAGASNVVYLTNQGGKTTGGPVG